MKGPTNQGEISSLSGQVHSQTVGFVVKKVYSGSKIGGIRFQLGKEKYKGREGEENGEKEKEPMFPLEKKEMEDDGG